MANMLFVKDILLQLLFALTPFVLYTIYYRDKAENYSKQFITITCMMCLFMSMTFLLVSKMESYSTFVT